MSLYIGVYIALFDYEPQTDEELKINQDDILYLLEKSDVDDWWKVKKRVLPVGDEEVEEPVGLVPSNYIDVAPVLKTCNALYDYAKQTDEELDFSEGSTFQIYDLNDPDWLLVGDTNGKYGFIPSNYVQMNDSGATTAPVSQPPQSNIPVTQFAPPPQHISRQTPSATVSQEEIKPPPIEKDQVEDLDPESEDEPPLPSRPQAQTNRPSQPMNIRRSSNGSVNDYGRGYDDDEVAPAMPSRPDVTPTKGRSRSSSKYEDEEDLNQEHTFDGEFFKWFIDEIDGRKKKPVMLAIGKGLIILKPNKVKSPSKLRLRSSSTSEIDNEWKIRDLQSFSNEKKHLFLEFKNPIASVELHCGSKDVSEAIMSILADLKGADNAKGLREVERASQSRVGGSNKRIGRLLYDFESQGDDELACREGDEVYILNESKSKDWWMCEKIVNGRQGVVPSSYIEIIGTSNLDKLTDAPDRQKSLKEKKKAKTRHRDRDEREKIREKDRLEREKASKKSKSSPSKNEDTSMPNYHRVRTWIDSSGSFKVEAEFLGCIEGKIHLHKTNGVKIAVAATKLCLEDLEYVEKVTGTSLQDYKDEVNRQNAKRKAHAERKSAAAKKDDLPPEPVSKSATAVINDVPPPQPTRPKSSTIAVNDPDYDWFEFFLNCGIDIGNCQRYTLNFNREQMDDKILEDITPSLLRTLGLREGDIIRVMKFLDNKYGRKRDDIPVQPTGALFTEPTGALKNNSSSDIPKVDAKALPTPSQPPQPTPAQPAPPQTTSFEDDAWAIKPAARSNEDLSKPSQPQQPQYTGSLQDLVNIKPLENKPPPAPVQSNSQTPSAAVMTPVKTGNLIQPGQQFGVQKTGNGTLVSPQKTGTLVPVQRTGGLIPVMTGGLMTAQPTGFIPIASQPTGFMPIQQTGGLAPQFTMGGTLIPIQTGGIFVQKTGGAIMPPTSFNQPILQTGGVTMPNTSFGQQPVFTQVTGGASMPPTSFGQPLSLQRTGPLIPVQKTGPMSQQITGGVPSQITGGMPPTSFGQPMQSFQPQSTFGQSLTGGGFGQGFQPQQPTGFQQQGFQGQGFQPQQPTGGFPQTSFGQPNGFPQTSFSQQPTGGFQSGFPQTSFGQPPNQQPSQFGQFQPQQTFNNFQQPNQMNQMTNMFQNTSISSPPTFNQQMNQMPTTSFGQPAFEGFSQPLQSQPTGSGFGNAPLTNQPTGRRANLSAATPDNPFGF
ncbi:actin cytoskeleton-regulatory complex protein Sla1p [[Candida] jaroonii]|uniref:Actin cytoskeleton-regulatory complex protein Sla1p n=1 Tax=[Candida] jaroonii TaxID=467808 RepID=A0ACA9Y519_9ASCO|nr:actin cytoskeleton-regulatory complex protein Sla1p [[Candida] jaroonii]